jgi:hypothetical protein
MHRFFAFIVLFFSQFLHPAFAPDTLINTPHGLTKIRYIQTHHTIVSYDEQNRSLAQSTIKSHRSYQATHAYKVTYDNGQSFITTPEQRLMLYDSHTWVEVKHIAPGNRLLCNDARFITIIAVAPFANEIMLHEISVTPHHTLLITEHGIITHNNEVQAVSVGSALLTMAAATPLAPVVGIVRGVLAAATVGTALWSLLHKKKHDTKENFTHSVASSGCSSPPPPKKPNDDDEFKKNHPYGRYEDVGYHKNHHSGQKSPRPLDGQAALDRSFPIDKGSDNRIGISNNQFVALNKTSEGVYHGHVRSWNELSDTMQAILRRQGLVSKKGKIICSIL